MSEEHQEWSAEKVESIKEEIMTALETVIDPELGIDIVNLGLIYEVDFSQNGDTVVKMTLTTMGCPLADVLTEQIHEALRDIPQVKNIEVKLVWYPAWTTDKMSRYARIALGIR
jgi:metal-sulfur cluster biosynthetic enzyme